MNYYKVYLTLMSEEQLRTHAACIAIRASGVEEAKQIAENRCKESDGKFSVGPEAPIEISQKEYQRRITLLKPYK